MRGRSRTLRRRQPRYSQNISDVAGLVLLPTDLVGVGVGRCLAARCALSGVTDVLSGSLSMSLLCRLASLGLVVLRVELVQQKSKRVLFVDLGYRAPGTENAANGAAIGASSSIGQTLAKLLDSGLCAFRWPTSARESSSHLTAARISASLLLKVLWLHPTISAIIPSGARRRWAKKNISQSIDFRGRPRGRGSGLDAIN